MSHIVLINVWSVINSKGGTGKVFCDMANALSKKGYEITAIFCDPNTGVPGFTFDDNVRLINSYKPSCFSFLYKNPWRNLRCLSFNKERRHFLRNTLDNRWRLNSIREALRVIPKADLFISYQFESTWILRECLGIDVPIVTMIHSIPSYYINQLQFPLYKKAVAGSAVLQVLLPEFIAETHNTFPSTCIRVIPNVAPKYEQRAELTEKKKSSLLRE